MVAHFFEVESPCKCHNENINLFCVPCDVVFLLAAKYYFHHRCRWVEKSSEGITFAGIRTLGECGNGHAAGIKHMDYYKVDFLNRMSAFDKTQPITIHCASGERSSGAANQLIEIGFLTVFDYFGNFENWMRRDEKME